MTTGARRLREMLAKPGPVVAPGAYDTLSALLIENLGFQAVYFGGFATAAHFGTTEPMLTLTQQAGVCEAAARYIQIPMLCDGHTGFGDPVHTVHSIRQFEAAGLAGIHIEDAVYPKRVHYFKGIKHTVPKEEMVEKVKAAAAARRSSDFLIIARTEAKEVDEAVDRLGAYVDAGAEAVMPMLFDLDDANAVRRQLPNVPFLWTGGLGRVFGHGDPSVEELSSIGYKIMIYPMMAIAGAARGLISAFTPLKERGVLEYDRDANDAAFFAIQEAIGMPDYYRIEAETIEKSGQGMPDHFMPAAGKAFAK